MPDSRGLASGRGRPLLLLHGWGMHGGIFADFAHGLSGFCQPDCADLPGYGDARAVTPYTLPRIAGAVLDSVAAPKFAVLGWSLGANVALEMYRQAPARILAIYLVAANPRFVAGPDWPGIDAAVLAEFSAALRTGIDATLSRFLGLQVYQAEAARQTLGALRNRLRARALPAAPVLAAGLDILAQSDLRPVLAEMTCPLHIVLGDRDRLVPVAAGQAMLALRPAAALHVVPGAGHVPFLSHASQLLNIIETSL